MMVFVLALALQLLGPGSEARGEIQSVRQGVYSRIQAERGAKVYQKICLNCHGVEQFVGPAYMNSWTGRTAFDLFERIRTTMPTENPGRLKRHEYTEILAYLFKSNGFPAGPTDMNSAPESLKQIRIEGPYDKEGQ